MFSWLVTTMEPERHAIPFTTLLPLMLVIASFAFIDAAVGPRDDPPFSTDEGQVEEIDLTTPTTPSLGDDDVLQEPLRNRSELS